jgi:hypothetical protein
MSEPLTLDDALTDAKATLRIYPDSPLSKWIVDHLGEAQPCTLEAPEVDDFGGIHLIGDEGMYNINFTEPAEAEAYAAMLLRAAEDARKKRAG